MTELATAEQMVRRWLTLADALVVPAGGGHINASFFVSERGSASGWLLQRVNRTVFPSPSGVMRNIEIVLAAAADGTSAIALPSLMRTLAGEAWLCDTAGELWRCWVVMPGVRSTTKVTGTPDAGEAGRAFGAFARLASTLDASQLADTIPGFHDTPARLARLEASIARNIGGRVGRAQKEIAQALHHRSLAPLLVEPLRSGVLPVRVAHNDAKIANVLFDATTGRAAMVIDLDTVMRGTPLFDFGDLVRSSVSTAPEDSTDLQSIHAEPALYQALLEGYLEGTAGLLSRTERSLLETAGRVITWEQSLRFLTDYLDGDAYFATSRPEHNLERARAQLALLASLNRQREAFEWVSLQS